MRQHFSANDEIMRAMVYEGFSNVSDKRGGDQSGLSVISDQAVDS